MNTKNSGFVDGDGVPAAGILTEAAKIVEGARQATHGPKERSFAVIAQLWMVYLSGRRDMTGCIITASDVSMMMVLLKMARAIQGTATRDHFVDLAGYGAIAGEISLNGDDLAAEKALAAAHAIMESNTTAGEGARVHRLEAENADLARLVRDLLRRLDMAASVFNEYAQHHHAKSPPDAAKAQRNADMAALCKGEARFGMEQRPEVVLPGTMREKMDMSAIRRAFGQE